ncbi:MAG: family 1 glycosylhydrolase, partial [Patescibacteria group bacterium]
ALRARGIEPFVTLWHWTFPLWVAGIGGFESKTTGKYFERYAKKMATVLPEVKFWITLNEPEVYASHTYLKGNWTPQKRNYFVYRKVIRNMVAAHITAYTAIKSVDKEANICIAKHNLYFEAYKGRFLNRMLKKAVDIWWNDWFLKKISRHQDLITVNNYHHNRVSYGFNKNENEKLSDMAWELYPESLALVARELAKYKLPIYVTEHGLADADDSRREWFIKESLRYLYKAIEDGAQVRGYLHWSLLDNFEWDKGFWPRFGLVEVDFKTQKRTIRPSAYEYAKICRENALEANYESV